MQLMWTQYSCCKNCTIRCVGGSNFLLLRFKKLKLFGAKCKFSYNQMSMTNAIMYLLFYSIKNDSTNYCYLMGATCFQPPLHQCWSPISKNLNYFIPNVIKTNIKRFVKKVTHTLIVSGNLKILLIIPKETLAEHQTNHWKSRAASL